jgi:aldose 1-epimerase
VDVWTEEPGMQLYTANFLDGTIFEKNDMSYVKHAAVCLETQHFPDSRNRPSFPTTILYPENVYQSVTVYAFGVKHK